MLTVKQLFIADGLDLGEDKIKLVRHVDHFNRSIQRIVAEEHFEFYQQEQSPKVRPFHNCEVILSFIGIEGNKASNFQWSIVRTVSTTLSPRDVIRIENHEKAKHGSRAIGLNGN